MAYPTAQDVYTAYKKLAALDPVTNTTGCYYWVLDTNGGIRKAICLGYSGYDSENICLKLGAQTTNNAMQCDIDIDWANPYSPATYDSVALDYYLDPNGGETLEYIAAAVSELLQEYEQLTKNYFVWC